MVETLLQQLAAAGGIALSANEIDLADAVLLVNNFDSEYQLEASQQPVTPNLEDYAIFDGALETSLTQKKMIGFCDNRYANGLNLYFIL